MTMPMTPKAPKGQGNPPSKGFRPEGPKPKKWTAIAGSHKEAAGTDSLNEKAKGTARGKL